MTKKKRGLGRGLDALLSASQTTTSESLQEAPVQEEGTEISPPEDGTLVELELQQLQPGQYQPRRDVQESALEELADSIRQQGLMQPIVVRPLPGMPDHYEIIAGERRWRACELAGLKRIPVLVRDVADESAIAMALIENIQRENLNPMEEAIALHRLQQEFGLTQQQVANSVGKNRTTVANLLRLMQLNTDVKRLLENGDLEMGHARALLGLTGQAQSDAAAQVVADSLNVRETEKLIRQLSQPVDDVEKTPVTPPSPDVMRLERLLGDRLGAKVVIRHGARGRGKVVIDYSSLDELDGILAHIK